MRRGARLSTARWRLGAGAVSFLALLLGGCAGTSRVDEAVTAKTLGESRTAVAIMRIGSASPACLHVAVLLGVREGPGYRRHQVLRVANVRSLAEPAVAEVELPPGEYHVIGYACQDGRHTMAIADKADADTYRTSYARFAVEAGEIVNVGYLHFAAARTGRNAFGRPVRTDVDVTDWPLSELERFRQTRPGLYAQMRTRLMTVIEPSEATPGPSDCDRLRVLKAEGKVQTLPTSCAAEAKAMQPAARKPGR